MSLAWIATGVEAVEIAGIPSPKAFDCFTQTSLIHARLPLAARLEANARSLENALTLISASHLSSFTVKEGEQDRPRGRLLASFPLFLVLACMPHVDVLRKRIRP